MTATAPALAPSTTHARHGVLVYAIGVLALSTVGGVVMASSDDPATSTGALLFVLSPMLLAVGLRTLGREGWADAGLRLGRERGWYAVALLLFPLLLAVPVALGALTGNVHVAPGAGQRFAVLFATGLVARMAFAAFEELGWRGYLEPRLAALGVPALRRHLAVGALWAVWHVPYIVALGDDYTELPLAVQLPLFSVAVLAMAVIWGVARDRTGSVLARSARARHGRRDRLPAARRRRGRGRQSPGVLVATRGPGRAAAAGADRGRRPPPLELGRLK